MNHPAVYHAAPAGRPFSTAVRIPGLLMLSGQIPFDDSVHPHKGSLEEQAHAVLKSIAATLESLGSSMDRVIKTNVWLSDLGDSTEFNRIYAGYFREGCYPVRSLVRADLAFGVRVEIEVQAVD